MYEKLKTRETSIDVPKKFRKAFEKALRDAWEYYNDNAFVVDALEDEPMLLAFSKGFLAGCIHVEKAMMDKAHKYFEEDLFEEEIDEDNNYVCSATANSVEEFIVNFKKSMENYL